MRRFQSFWHWLTWQISSKVPAQDALCEFDCRKPQCFEGEWENCMRRLRQGAGELMPLKAPRPNP